ncbi:MAG: transporter [Candidatus Margulisbacteria bacterium]|jgi:hypothetical protein|nr:transporter [Candidatus Margulisiibacteriota bacterium]
MKKLLVLPLVLCSLVFAEFGAYVPLDITNPSPRVGLIWSLSNKFKLPVDVQAEFINDKQVEDVKDGARVTETKSAFALQGTYYFLTKGDWSLGAFGRLAGATSETKNKDSDTEDKTSGTTWSFGGSAKWQLNDRFSIKADVAAVSLYNAENKWDYGTTDGKITHSQTTFLPNATISFLVDLL